MSLVEALGLDASCSPRIATGFGGGIACHGEVCGAIVGVIMALGLKFGREKGEDRATKEALYARVDRLVRGFQAEFGTTICRELTGCDMTTPEGRECFARDNLHNTLCPKFAVFAADEALKLAQVAGS